MCHGWVDLELRHAAIAGEGSLDLKATRYTVGFDKLMYDQSKTKVLLLSGAERAPTILITVVTQFAKGSSNRES